MMINLSQDISIMRNVAEIERLKCAILADVATLFQSMATSSAGTSVNPEILASIIEGAYLLSARLGRDAAETTNRVARRIKREQLASSEPDIFKSALLNYITRHTED